MTSKSTRPLTDEERTLLRWMLENGGDEARAFLPQLDLAEATTWKCPCGCASFNLKIQGHAEPRACGSPIADFVFAQANTSSGIMIMGNEGVLTGLEVYGGAGNAPTTLPRPEELRPFGNQ